MLFSELEPVLQTDDIDDDNNINLQSDSDTDAESIGLTIDAPKVSPMKLPNSCKTEATFPGIYASVHIHKHQ